MKAIWLLGCEGSSELVDLTSGTPVVAWNDRNSLALGSLHAMTLNAAGTGPGPSPASTLQVRGHVKGYMSNLEAVIRADLNNATGWQVSIKPYDWRESIERTAAMLSLQVLALPPGDLPLTIVAHGQGGLIARAVWRTINLAGESARIRRIITMGAAQYGCYASCDTLLAKDGWQASLLAQPNQSWILYNPSGPQPTTSPYDQGAIARIAATWPSVYEQLPFVSTPGITDPTVPALYLATTWPNSYGISQAWLDHAKNVFQPRLTDLASYPPGHVMTCYVAGGSQTTNALLPLNIPGLRRFPSPMSTDDGDGRVLTPTQSILGSANLTLIGDHYTLPDNPAILTTIVAQITEERVGPGPFNANHVPAIGGGVNPAFPLDPIATIPQAAVPTPQGLCPMGKCSC